MDLENFFLSFSTVTFSKEVKHEMPYLSFSCDTYGNSLYKVGIMNMDE